MTREVFKERFNVRMCKGSKVFGAGNTFFINCGDMRICELHAYQQRSESSHAILYTRTNNQMAKIEEPLKLVNNDLLCCVNPFRRPLQRISNVTSGIVS